MGSAGAFAPSDPLTNPVVSILEDGVNALAENFEHSVLLSKSLCTLLSLIALSARSSVSDIRGGGEAGDVIRSWPTLASVVIAVFGGSEDFWLWVLSTSSFLECPAVSADYPMTPSASSTVIDRRLGDRGDGILSWKPLASAVITL